MDALQDLVNMRLAFEDENKGTSLTEFKRFSELPQELRLIIWNFTVPVSRLVEDRFCRLPLKPISVPLNSIPYSSMPDSFRACFESKEEITRHYTQAEYGGDSGQACDDLLIHFAPSVPLNSDKDILSFDSLFTISTDYWQLFDFLQGQGPLPLGLPDWRNELFPNCRPWIIKPWTVKRVQITPLSLLLPLYMERKYGYEEDNFTSWNRIFVGFVFQDLDEFIVQDFDCKLTEKHSFYSLKDQEAWKKRILLMLQVETTHDEYSDMRAGSRFKIPTIEICRGAKVEEVCQNCRELSQDKKRTRHFKKWRAKQDAMRQQWLQGQSSHGTNGTVFEQW